MRRVSVFLLVLTACSGTNDPANDYVRRLQNVLNTEIADPGGTTIVFPLPREIKRTNTPNTLSIREFLSLRQCRLHTVLAHRNSAIGKVASASQRLFSDLDILASGPSCIEKLDESPLKEKLIDYLEQKRATIGQSLWDAILGAEEHRLFWSTVSTPQLYPLDLNQDTEPDLRALTVFVRQVLMGEYEFSDTHRNQIEAHLGQLRFGDGGALLDHFSTLNQALNRGNQIILRRLERPLCLQPQATTSSRHFQNVVQAFFIPTVQKQAVLLNQRDAQIMPAHRALENSLSAFAPQAYNDWAQRRDNILAAGRSAAKRHVTLIQQLYLQCGLVSGNRATMVEEPLN